MKNSYYRKHKVNRVAAICVVLLAALPTISLSQNYSKLLRDVSIGMDSVEVVKITGKPTKSLTIERFFYGSDQIVISNDEIIDIRIKDRVKPSKKTVTPQRPIAPLRIGMKRDRKSVV